MDWNALEDVFALFFHEGPGGEEGSLKVAGVKEKETSKEKKEGEMRNLKVGVEQRVLFHLICKLPKRSEWPKSLHQMPLNRLHFLQTYYKVQLWEKEEGKREHGQF